MHFFNPRPLAEKLRDGVLSERDKFRYIIATLVMQFADGLPHRLMNSWQPMLYLLLAGIFYTLVSYLGLRACFATNERGDNKAFVERWLCLSLPLSLWTIVLPTYLGLAAYVIYALTGRAYAGFFGLFSFLLAAITWSLLILYFVLLNRFMAIAASSSGLNANPSTAPIALP